jgi:hypothetical protein
MDVPPSLSCCEDEMRSWGREHLAPRYSFSESLTGAGLCPLEGAVWPGGSALALGREDRILVEHVGRERGGLWEPPNALRVQ